MPLEEDFNDFNSAVSQEEEIIHAKNLINESLEKAAGTVYSQKTAIQFNPLKYERIIESFQLLFFRIALRNHQLICSEVSRKIVLVIIT